MKWLSHVVTNLGWGSKGQKYTCQAFPEALSISRINPEPNSKACAGIRRANSVVFLPSGNY